MPASPVEPPSFSTLMLLFADAWAPAGGRRGFPVPCVDATVDPAAASPGLAAAAFWALADAGAVAISMVERPMTEVIENYRKVSGMEPPPGAFVERDVAVKALGSSAAGGLEGELLAALAGELSVVAAVDAWFVARFGRMRFGSPELELVMAVAETAASAGLGSYSRPDAQSAARTFGMSALFGKAKVEADCEAVQRLRPTFDELLSRYRAWGAANPELREELIRGCGSGIGGRTAHSSD